MPRRRLNLPALLGAFTGALVAVAMLATGAAADDSDINSLIGADDIGTGHASAPLSGLAAPGMDSADAPAGDTERWLAANGPIGALSVISVHPLPGETCQSVLFDMRPSARVRHAAEPGTTLELGLGDLCLFGLRNDSDQRAIAIRLGEELRTVAIGIDSRLHSGLTIGPGHEVLTPIRPLSIEAVGFDVEVVWDDLIDSGEAVPSAFHVVMTSDPSQGS